VPEPASSVSRQRRYAIDRGAEPASITAAASTVALLSHVARLLLRRRDQEPKRRSDGDETSFEGALVSLFPRQLFAGLRHERSVGVLE
jgi:hypothetical protein